MNNKKLSDMPNLGIIKSDIEINEAHTKLSGYVELIKNGELHMQEAGLIELIHMLCEHVVNLEDEINKLKNK